MQDLEKIDASTAYIRRTDLNIAKEKYKSMR